jgi:hypothetical protein
MQLNTLHQSNWKVTFSNLPTINQSEMFLFDNFIKSITLPNYELGEEKSYFQNVMIRHPNTKANIDLPQLQITFRTTEDLQNYYRLMLWSMQIKYGKPDSTYEDFIRNYTINTINLHILDNEKRERNRISFTKAFMSSLSSIGLEHGSDAETLFTAIFTYEEVTSLPVSI